VICVAKLSLDNVMHKVMNRQPVSIHSIDEDIIVKARTRYKTGAKFLQDHATTS